MSSFLTTASFQLHANINVIRKCKKDKGTIIADSIAEKMCQRDPRKFWKDVKHRVNSNTKIPTNIDGVHGDDNIISMWKHHYENIFNTVQDSGDKAYIDLCQDDIDFNTDMTVDAGEMTIIINDLSCNESPGLDGLTAEHMKYADSQLLVLLSVLVSSILVHGYIPKVITESVFVPVIKDKNRCVNDKGNYRPICLSNIGSKIVEAVLLNRMDV